MRRMEAGQRVATALFDTETAIDQALQSASVFVTVMSSVRLDNNIAATVGAQAMSNACGAIQALGSARQQIVAAHDVLDDAKALVGLRNVRMGGTGMGKPEKDVPRTSGQLADAA